MWRNSPGVKIARSSYRVKKDHAVPIASTHEWMHPRNSRPPSCFFCFVFCCPSGHNTVPHPPPLADNSKSCLRHYSEFFFLHLHSHSFRRRDLGFVASEVFRRSHSYHTNTKVLVFLKCVLAETKHLQLSRLYVHCKSRLTYKPRMSETTVDFRVSGKHQYRLHCNL
jgi:hypothetical protein